MQIDIPPNFYINPIHILLLFRFMTILFAFLCLSMSIYIHLLCIYIHFYVHLMSIYCVGLLSSSRHSRHTRTSSWIFNLGIRALKNFKSVSQRQPDRFIVKDFTNVPTDPGPCETFKLCFFINLNNSIFLSHLCVFYRQTDRRTDIAYI